MSRVLRGAWSRRGPLLTLVAMTTVVVGGAVAVLRFAEAAGLSRALTAPLLLLGAVAVPSIGAQLAVARREEVGLARLRGIHGARLWRFLLLEPLLAILLGVAAGLALGAVLARVSTSAWLGDAATPLSPAAVLGAVAIGAVGLLIVVLGTVGALREPLAVQVATRRRPQRATTLAVFLTVLVIVAAAVAAYRSRMPSSGQPDLIVLLGPALVGLALGQVAVWVVRGAARAATGPTSRRGMGAFLATRRLARADDLVSPLRLVVAAAVVGTLALTGSAAVAGWSATQARIESPGPVSVDFEDNAFGALALTRELDPAGDHLMATAVVPSEDRLAERRAYADTARWDSVVGDFYDGTRLEAAAGAVERLVPAEAAQAWAPARDLTVRGTAIDKAPLGRPGPAGVPVASGLVVEVSYVGADNSGGSASVELDLPRPGSRDERSTAVDGCRQACQVTAISVSRVVPAGDRWVTWDDSAFTTLLERVRFGSVELTDLTWAPDEQRLEAGTHNRWGPSASTEQPFLVNRPDGLQVRPLPEGETPFVLAAAGEQLPVLVAGDSSEATLDLGGAERPTQVVGEADVLPLVGAEGRLADLPASALGSGSTVPGARVSVVVAPGAPPGLVDQLEQAAGSSARSFDDVQRALRERTGAAQSRAYALTAAACALVALLALAAGVARHVRDYRTDVASLRVLGIGLATNRRAGRVELVSLTLLVSLAVALGGWLAVTLLLGGLPLVSPPAAALTVDTGAQLWPLVVPAGLAALAVVLVGGRARAVRPASTRPSLLREEEGR